LGGVEEYFEGWSTVLPMITKIYKYLTTMAEIDTKDKKVHQEE